MTPWHKCHRRRRCRCGRSRGRLHGERCASHPKHDPAAIAACAHRRHGVGGRVAGGGGAAAVAGRISCAGPGPLRSGGVVVVVVVGGGGARQEAAALRPRQLSACPRAGAGHGRGVMTAVTAGHGRILSLLRLPLLMNAYPNAACDLPLSRRCLPPLSPGGALHPATRMPAPSPHAHPSPEADCGHVSAGRPARACFGRPAGQDMSRAGAGWRA